jgi:succinate-semialdehyde dehydrogenase/glutarate-semialdehyde dehydrogenase
LKQKEYHFDNYDNKIDFNPLGVILAINPWNFPVWVGFKSIIPAMIAGNTILFKPSATVPQINLKLEEIFKESGMEDQFKITFTKTAEIGEKLIADPKIRSVIFTGSTNVGSIVGSLAGKHLKKSLLELGGSDPFIVFDDADLEQVNK